MNCKPDQLCRVVSGAHAQAIVTTRYRCGCGSDRVDRPMWTCESMQHLNVGGRDFAAGTQICCADSNLKPLGGEDKDTRDVTIKDKLQDYMKKETKKIIPLVWNPEGEKV